MRKVLLLFIVLITSFLSASAINLHLLEQDNDTTKTESDSAKVTDYQKLFKDKHVTAKGFITLHNIKGKLYFEFPLDLFDREMIIGSTITEISNNANAIVGSKPSAPIHVKFTKYGENIQLRSINTNYAISDHKSNIAKAIEKSSTGAVIKNIKITAYSPDSTSVVFDMTDFFVGDNKDMSPFDDFSYYTMAGYNRTQSFQSDKSFLGTIKAFSDNVTIQSHLSYLFSLSNKNKETIAKDIPFTAVVTRSIVLLKPDPYRPRYGDYRMAIFPTGKHLVSKENQPMDIIYYSNRWDLQPTDTLAYLKGDKVKPVKPIVFYIDPNFPGQWKKYIHEGVEQWNELFSEVGFKEAIQAREYPKDDPEFDPDNIKYSCIRYAPIGISNAMGPSWTDPRSGEILTASVYVYHDIIKLLNNWLFIQTSQTVKDVRTKNIPDSIIGDGLRYVIAHEIGHCLGLMHNMRASSHIPVDSLRSPSFTQKYGTTYSIMDYARFNYVAQPGDYEKGVRMSPPRFGEYDKFSINWLYKVFPDKSYEEEKEILSNWIREHSNNPIYQYGKQQIYHTYDPRSQAEDLGDDAMKASDYGIANLKYILNNFDDWIEGEDEDFSYRSDIYNGIINQYLQYIVHVYANVGGVYLQEIKEGDSGELYKSVPSEIQREALKFLMNQIGHNNWLFNRALSAKIGISGSVSDLVDMIIAKMIINAPSKVVVSSTLAEEDPYSFIDCADEVFDFIWSSTKKRKAPSKTEKLMQQEYIDNFLVKAKLADAKPQRQAFSSFITEDSRHLNCFCHQSALSRNHPQISIHNPVAGYEWMPEFRLFYPISANSDYFIYILRTKDLLKRAVRFSSGETRSHYQYLLNKIENTLK